MERDIYTKSQFDSSIGKFQVAYEKIQDVSSIDYPNHLAMVMFMNLCPNECVYCYNKTICDRASFKRISKAKETIDSMVGFVDSIIFTGGEPLMQIDALITLAKFAESKNLHIGLQTSGAYPINLEVLLNEVNLNYLALDIKAPLNDNMLYEKITKSSKLIHCALKTLTLSDLYDIPNLEIRTTVAKELLEIQHVRTIAEQIASYPVSTYAIQNLAFSINGYQPHSRSTLDQMLEEARQFVPNSVLREQVINFDK